MDAVERYVIDEKGQRVAVILPLKEYEKLQEDLHDLAVAAERRDEKTISLAELKKRLATPTGHIACGHPLWSSGC